MELGAFRALLTFTFAANITFINKPFSGFGQDKNFLNFTKTLLWNFLSTGLILKTI
jgi:hypothetical protein